MARKIMCPVCESEHFRRVVVTLPSGKDRITEFEACARCATVFHRRRESAVQAPSNISDFASHIPVNVAAEIARTFPNASTTTVDMQSAHYKHPTFGRLVLIFKRSEAVGTGEKGMKWHLVEATRLHE